VPAADRMSGTQAVLSSSSHFLVLGRVRVNPHAGQLWAVSEILAKHSWHLIKAIIHLSNGYWLRLRPVVIEPGLSRWDAKELSRLTTSMI